MTGPLPLTPTPPRTSVPTCLGYNVNLPLAGAFGPRGDDSLPEKLVRDLELSKSVFEERNMTSGAPDPPIISPYKPSSSHASSAKAFRTASSRVQALDALQQRAPMASFFDELEPVLKFDDTASDVDSFIGTEASYDAGPSTFHTRNQSIVTNATSLASSGRRPSSKSVSPILSSWRPSSRNHRSPGELRRESSWIEVESESEDEGDIALPEFRRHLFHQQSHRRHRQPSFDQYSSRSPKPSKSSAPDGVANGPRQPVSFNRFPHRKSHSISGPAPGLSQHHSTWSISDTWLSSSPCRPKTKPRTPNRGNICDYPGALPKFSSELRPRQVSRRSQPVEETMGHVSRKSINTAITEQEYSQPPVATTIKLLSKRHHSEAYTRPPPPSPPSSHAPRVSIQLHSSSSTKSKSDEDGGSSQPFVLPFKDDELARIVPLPPDVIETLRISTMCFPETMLLCSSLTIETIRSYSKKARQPGAERLSMAAAATQFTFSAGPAGPVMPVVSSSPTSGTKSRWRRVVGRASPCSKKKRESRFWESSAESPSAPVFEAPKPWLSLKNVFGNCSDYICDALYAHIVAYNYVSALVARNPPPSPSNSRRSCSGGPSDNEDIPKKAASLLGFGHSASVALIGVASRAAKKPRPSSKTLGVSSHDAALRAIQCELQRCIRQLISTARLMAEDDTGEGEDRPLEMETQDNDRILMRSLCEIVRISEGAAYGC